MFLFICKFFNNKVYKTNQQTKKTGGGYAVVEQCKELFELPTSQFDFKLPWEKCVPSHEHLPRAWGEFQSQYEFI